jgi:hypothetical protein
MSGSAAAIKRGNEGAWNWGAFDERENKVRCLFTAHCYRNPMADYGFSKASVYRYLSGPSSAPAATTG